MFVAVGQLPECDPDPRFYLLQQYELDILIRDADVPFHLCGCRGGVLWWRCLLWLRWRRGRPAFFGELVFEGAGVGSGVSV